MLTIPHQLEGKLSAPWGASGRKTDLHREAKQNADLTGIGGQTSH